MGCGKMSLQARCCVSIMTHSSARALSPEHSNEHQTHEDGRSPHCESCGWARVFSEVSLRLLPRPRDYATKISTSHRITDVTLFDVVLRQSIYLRMWKCCAGRRKKIRGTVLRRAAAKLGHRADELDVKDGQVYCDGGPQR